MDEQYSKNPLLEIKDLNVHYSLPFRKGTRSSPFTDARLTYKAPYIPHLHTVKLPYEKKNHEQERLLWQGSEKDLVYDRKPGTLVKAIDGASLTVYKNESTGLVGESGCGKTSLLMSVFRLFPSNVKLANGEIWYHPPDEEPVDLNSLENGKLRQFFGRHMSLILQNPGSALDPLYQVGFQVGEALENLSWRQELIRERVIEYLGKVALGPGTGRKWSSQLSKGEVQRICIASALIADSAVLFGDEPLISLDTIVQSQIIQLLLDLKKELGITFVFAMHDLGVASRVADAIAVMYGGEIIESQPTRNFFDGPLHPYSQGLLQATPWYVDQHGLPLNEIPGNLPSATNWPAGCKFHPRCEACTSLCTKVKPPRVKIGDGFVECFLYA
ncbi:MAG: ABC transporter ATP-binding protein [Candidatus Odinarchaeota archaeon]